MVVSALELLKQRGGAGQVGAATTNGGGLTEKNHPNDNLKEASEVDTWGEDRSRKSKECTWHVGGMARKPCDCQQKMCKYNYTIM